MKFGDYTKLKSLQTPAGFRANLESLGLDMPCDDIVASGPAAPLAQGFRGLAQQVDAAEQNPSAGCRHPARQKTHDGMGGDRFSRARVGGRPARDSGECRCCRRA